MSAKATVIELVWAALITLTSVMLTSTMARAEAPPSLPELAAKAKPSVVHLIIVDAAGREAGSGTGFFVAGGRIVTNAHVIAKAHAVRAKLADGRALDVSGILALDANKDIAIIATQGRALPPPLPLGSSSRLRQGDEVIVIGSPRGLSGTLSTGIVSALRGDGIADPEGADRHEAWAIQVTAAISPGSSGSPIMTRDGKVVAVAVGIFVGQGNLNFGVPIEHVEELLATLPANAVAVPFTEQPGSGSVTQNLIISAVVFGLIAMAFVLPGFVRKRRRKTSGRKRRS